MAQKRPSDDDWSDGGPAKRKADLYRPSTDTSSLPRRPLPDRVRHSTSGHQEERHVADGDRTSDVGSSPLNTAFSGGHARATSSGQLIQPSTALTLSTSKPPPTAAVLLGGLLALAGKINHAHLLEEAAQKQVEQCQSQLRNSEKYVTFPSFGEIHTAALNEAKEDLARKHRVVQETITQQTALVEQFTEALALGGGARQVEDLARNNLEERFKDFLETNQKESAVMKRQIDEQKATIEKQDAAIIKLIAQVEAQGLTVKTTLKEHDDSRTKKLDDALSVFRKTATETAQSLSQQMSNLITEDAVNMMLIPFGASVQSAVEQGERFELQIPNITAIQAQATQLQHDMEILKRQSQETKGRLFDDIEPSSFKKLEEELHKHAEALEAVYSELGDDENGIHCLLAELNAKLGNLELEVRDARPQPTASVDPESFKELLESYRSDVHASVQNTLSELTTQMNEKFTSLRPFIHDEVETYCKELEQDMVVTNENFQKALEEIKHAAQKIPELTQRQDLIESKFEDSQKSALEEQNKTSASIARIDRDLADTRGHVQQTANGFTVRLSVLEEGHRFLSDRYNFTTSDDVVQAMCREFQKRFAPDPAQKQINQNIQLKITNLKAELGRFNEEHRAVQLRNGPWLTEVTESLANCLDKLERLETNDAARQSSIDDVKNAQKKVETNLTEQCRDLQVNLDKAQESVKNLVDKGEVSDRFAKLDAAMKELQDSCVKLDTEFRKQSTQHVQEQGRIDGRITTLDETYNTLEERYTANKVDVDTLRCQFVEFGIDIDALTKTLKEGIAAVDERSKAITKDRPNEMVKAPIKESVEVRSMPTNGNTKPKPTAAAILNAHSRSTNGGASSSPVLSRHSPRETSSPHNRDKIRKASSIQHTERVQRPTSALRTDPDVPKTLPIGFKERTSPALGTAANGADLSIPKRGPGRPRKVAKDDQGPGEGTASEPVMIPD